MEKSMERKRKKRFALGGLLALAYAMGFTDAFLQRQGPDVFRLVMLATGLIGTFFSLYWFTLDASEHDYVISKKLYVMLGVFGFLAAPYYFWRAHGRGAFKAIGLLLLFIFLAGTANALGTGAAELAPGFLQALRPRPGG